MTQETKLHAILAVEKTRTSQSTLLSTDAQQKFKKASHYFNGHLRTLKMLTESPENVAIEEAAREEKTVPTTVHETLNYMLNAWATAEDISFIKNTTNTVAFADIIFRGNTIVKNVPVDELLSLEVKLENLRKVLADMPTLDASKTWVASESGRLGEHVSISPEKVSKTEKRMTPVVLYAATEKHPAQIEKIQTDAVIGTFTKILYSGEATSAQKAEVLSVMDDLLVATKDARMRANCTNIVNVQMGDTIKNLIMDCFKS